MCVNQIVVTDIYYLTLTGSMCGSVGGHEKGSKEEKKGEMM